MEEGFEISSRTVCNMLRKLGYTLQRNKKVMGEIDHPDRDEQIEHINDITQQFLKEGEPVVSVDTKKKELVGYYKNPGREWHKKGEPIEVNCHDFPDPKLGKAIPYGIYDIADNQGWVNVGKSADTAEFAVESIKLGYMS